MSPGEVCNALQDLGGPRTIRRVFEVLKLDGKVKLSGTNPKNLLGN